ncbi:ATP-grasp domain-containing protein [Edwardsiella tarda]|uniref:ATP-grasp domain-containing protein n=1 Tax=Edwardsiella tarda TaxID=636 RepID=UPI00351C8339
MMESILILGGTYFQIPVIECAKSKGYFVITCDYLPNNPGHKYSDKYYNVSTTDKTAVLDIAIKENVIGVIAFASDPAAPIAAYVNEKIGVNYTSYESICILSEKDRWRDFLSKNKFNSPKSIFFSSMIDLDVGEINYPVMVKPTDSSGSKGVSLVHDESELEVAIEYAASYSRNNRLIIEEFIDKIGCQIGGDAFIGDGKVEFICFGDQQVDNNINQFVPCGMIFPSKISEVYKDKIISEINRLSNLLNLKNIIINIEVMLDKNDNIYLMEIGPRSGGNFIHKSIKDLTGIDLVEIAVDSLTKKVNIPSLDIKSKKHAAYYAIHADKKGIIRKIRIKNKNDLTSIVLFKNVGDEINTFNGSNETIGILNYIVSDYDNALELFKDNVEVIS